MKGEEIEVGFAGHDEFTRGLLEENDTERLRLAESMQKVNEMFVDTQKIALEQGAALDRIDINCTQAVGHTAKAVEQLEITDRRQRSKKFCVCSMMVLAVVGSVALIVCLSVLV